MIHSPRKYFLRFIARIRASALYLLGFGAVAILFSGVVDDKPIRFVLYSASIPVIQFITVLIHEMAHAVVALTFRMMPLSIHIGHGRFVWKIGGRNIVFIFRAYPNEGFVLPGKPDPRWFPNFL